MPQGFAGFVDFVGYPVGQGVARRTTGAPSVGAKKAVVLALIQQQMQRSLVQRSLELLHFQRVVTARLEARRAEWEQEIARRQQLISNANFVAILAES